MGGGKLPPIFQNKPMALLNEIISGLKFEEDDLSNPVYTWNGNDYPCVPSVSEVTRDLDTGGFTIDKILTLSARLLDDTTDGCSNTELYATYPQPQQLITYNGDLYRIISTKMHPTRAYMRIMAAGITRGI